MNTVSRNIVANYLGGFWSALMGFGFVPLYIRYMGMEAYGLVGVFVSLQVWFALLDMGISHALSREMARYSAGAHEQRSIHELFRSLEIVYLVIAAVLAVGFGAATHWIAADWLRLESLSVATVQNALGLIGVVVALRWVGALYRGALIGLQRQVWLSACNAVFSTLRNACVVLVLAFVSPTIEAFFIYQLIVAAIEVLVLALGSRRSLPNVSGVRFSFDALRHIWRFAGGMAVISLLSILLTQVDKLILSRMLPLSAFGHYTMAFTAASVLHLMTTPVGNAAYPRMTELVTGGDHVGLASAFHSFSQILAAVLVPIAIVLAVFGDYVLYLWTQDEVIALAVAPLFSMLVIGNMLNGLMHIPYNLQLAHAWTRFMVKVNTIALIVLVPVVYVGVAKFGAIAAAAAWVLLNASYLIVAVPLMHRKILPEELWRWYRSDVAMPAAVALVVVLGARLLLGPLRVDELIWTACSLVVVTVVAIAATAWALPRVRELLHRRLWRISP